MAILNASTATLDLSLDYEMFWTDTAFQKLVQSISHDPNHVREQKGNGYVSDYYGSGFVYGPQQPDGAYVPSQGLLTGASVSLNGVSLLTLTGLSVDMSALAVVTSDRQSNLLLLSGNDTITLGSGKDTIAGFAGNDVIDGGPSQDTAVFSGQMSDYTISRTATGYVVKDNIGPDGTDTLSNIERFQFADGTLALDINGNAGQAYRLYRAAFDRMPDSEGLKYWVSQLDYGIHLQTIASAFISSTEFQSLYGADPSPSQLITLMYNNVLHREPDPGGFYYWLSQFSTGAVTRDSLLVNFSESAENQAAVIGVIQNGIELF